MTEIPKTFHNNKRELVQFDSFGEIKQPNVHFVQLVALKESMLHNAPGLKSIYVLDLASARHGYPNPIVPFLQFCETRVYILHKPKGFGYEHGWLREAWEEKIRRGNFDGVLKAVFALMAHASEFLLSRTEIWLEQNKLSAKSMLRLPLLEFKAKETELVNFIKSGIVLDPTLLRNFRGAIRAKIAPTALVSPLSFPTTDF
jgi:hypothetical protein